jgi:hypothetical protein
MRASRLLRGVGSGVAGGDFGQKEVGAAGWGAFWGGVMSVGLLFMVLFEFELAASLTQSTRERALLLTRAASCQTPPRCHSSTNLNRPGALSFAALSRRGDVQSQPNQPSGGTSALSYAI